MTARIVELVGPWVSAIRQARDWRCMTQRETARAAGMHLARFVELERSEQVPSMAELLRLALVLGQPAAELLLPPVRAHHHLRMWRGRRARLLEQRQPRRVPGATFADQATDAGLLRGAR